MAAESSVRWGAVLACVLVFGASTAACGGDDADDLTCVEDLPETCTPGFTPAWAGVYQNVIMRSCGVSGGANCHGSDSKAGDLDMSTSSGAYDALLGKDGTRARVIPNDPSCSLLMERLTTTDPNKRMPLGVAKLSDSSICAIQRWIEQGAPP